MKIRRLPDWSGRWLIKIRQRPNWSGCCLINSGSCLIDQAAAWSKSGNCLINQAATMVKSGSCLIDQAAARLKSGICLINQNPNSWEVQSRLVKGMVMVLVNSNSIVDIFLMLLKIGAIICTHQEVEWSPDNRIISFGFYYRTCIFYCVWWVNDLF